jgi:EpsI family protein
LALLVLMLSYAYLPVLGALVTTWRERDDYSFGFLIPVISLYLVWYRRERLKQLPIQPAYLTGLLALVTVGSMLLVGAAGNVMVIQELSLVGMIAALVLLLMGKAYLRALAFPLAYLLFMIPIADEIIEPLHWSFQLMTAKISVGILQALGFTALLDGQYIVLPTITLEVAKACSGINYLISIIAIGIPLAYMTQKNVWCRVVLVVSAVAIGIAANWIRVASIGIWAYYGGEVVHGPFHVFQGLFVSQIGFVALFVGAWGLSKVPASRRTVERVGADLARPAEPFRLDARSWLAAFLLLLALTAYFAFHTRAPVSLKAELRGFPLSIGNWRGQERSPQNAVFRVEGADRELVRLYRSPSGREVELYVAYFESQRHPKKLVNYRTARLHQDAVAVEIPLAQNESMTVNQTRLQQGRGELPVLFWYDMNGRIQADRYRAVLTTTVDSLIHGRTNGALILVAGVPIDRENGEVTIKEVQDFVRDAVPVLRGYLP